LHSLEVTTICGKVGKRGYDYSGGKTNLNE